jgi:hypothetical protein
LDKKLVGAILITLIALVFAVSLRYYTTTQSNQTSILSPSSTPTPETTPTQSPAVTPTPTPHALQPANLVLNCTLKMIVESTDRPRLRIYGTITNIGEETAGNITLHIRTWFSNGTAAIVIDKLLYWSTPGFPFPVTINGGSTYTFGISSYEVTLDVPDFAIGTDWTNATAYSDCISSYQITASWESIGD